MEKNYSKYNNGRVVYNQVGSYIKSSKQVNNNPGLGLLGWLISVVFIGLLMVTLLQYSGLINVGW